MKLSVFRVKKTLPNLEAGKLYEITCFTNIKSDSVIKYATSPTRRKIQDLKTIAEILATKKVPLTLFYSQYLFLIG